MSSQLIDYNKVKQACNILSLLSNNNYIYNVTKEILQYIQAFPGCNSTELERYVFHKSNGKMLITQPLISNRVRILIREGIISRKRDGKFNKLYIGERYYQIAKTIYKHKNMLNYNEEEFADEY